MNFEEIFDFLQVFLKVHGLFFNPALFSLCNQIIILSGGTIMKKFLCGLCTSLLLTYVVAAPLNSAACNPNADSPSSFAFYIAVEDD